MPTFQNPSVEEKFASYSPMARRKLLAVRKLILKVASMTPGVGALEETLKWGEPAYLTQNGSGSTVRIDWKSPKPNQYAMYFNCQTHLVETFRRLFPNDFHFEGNRALVFDLQKPVSVDALAACIEMALTYHLKKRRSAEKRH